jgi:hypothetical protein
MKINITDNERETADGFAHARMESSSLYQKRGGFKAEDIVSGALGEIAVYKVLKKAGYELRKPDFDIYDTRGKSYDADLRIKNKHFHVKSQTKESAEKYGRSWLCQRRDPLFAKGGYNHYLVTTVVDLDKNEVEVLGFFPMYSVLKKDLVGECKLEWFRKTKVAIYFKDLDENISKAQRWRIVS